MKGKLKDQLHRPMHLPKALVCLISGVPALCFANRGGSRISAVLQIGG